MLVSIIITNFNYGKYLKKCLDSCFNQNFSKKKYEVILIDDHSTDGSQIIAQKYLNKKNFHFIKNKKNIGVAASSNIGVINSKGTFFVRVDSDDYVNKNFIKFLHKHIQKKREILGVTSDYYYFYSKIKKLDKIKYKNKPISCGVMYNKKKLIKLGLYNIKFKHREEEELRKRLGKKYILSNLNKTLYYYRIHKNNKTKNKNPMKNFKVKLSKLYN